MSQSRIETFKTMLRDQPDEPMIWYGLANEFAKLGEWIEAADALRHVVRLNPDYTAAYQMLGTALLNQGETEEAGQVWSAGAQVAARNGASNAEQHIKRLLDDLATKTHSPFCQ